MLGGLNFMILWGEVVVCNLQVILKDCNVISQLESPGLSARATGRSRWKLCYFFRIFFYASLICLMCFLDLLNLCICTANLVLMVILPLKYDCQLEYFGQLNNCGGPVWLQPLGYNSLFLYCDILGGSVAQMGLSLPAMGKPLHHYERH